METELLNIINDCEECFDRETMNEVMHFYNHGEFEMALEGFLIEMINRKKYPPNYPISYIFNLCYYYKIDKESVFDSDIWNKLLIWKDEYYADSSHGI
ncbi:MAG: hypothetical protein IJP69_04285 [Synergistaceae bacterium]|nr:hypothetical protein [Synergistaceae bacterium]